MLLLPLPLPMRLHLHLHLLLINLTCLCYSCVISLLIQIKEKHNEALFNALFCGGLLWRFDDNS
jgi:hypothetical protein